MATRIDKQDSIEGESLECIHFNSETASCFMKAPFLPFKPGVRELKSLCKSNEFRKCERLKAYQDYLGKVVGKEGAWFVDPSLMPRRMLLARARELTRALAPSEEYETEFARAIGTLFFDEVRSTYRRNFSSEMRLEKANIGAQGLAVKVDLLWKYEVHNMTDNTVPYRVPMSVKTYSFVHEGLPIEEHIGIRQIEASLGESGDWNNLIKKYKLDEVKVKPASTTHVELVLTGKAVQNIPPKTFIRVNVNFFYMAELHDRQSQRMLSLTRNLDLALEYPEDEFIVDIESYCLPTMTASSPDHGRREFSWNGWFLPYHGIGIEWVPSWMHEQLEEKVKKRMKANGD